MNRKIESLGPKNIQTMKLAVYGTSKISISRIIKDYDVAPIARKYSEADKKRALNLLKNDYNNAVEELNQQTKSNEKSHKAARQKKTNEENALKREAIVIDNPSINKLERQLEKMKGQSLIVEYIIRDDVLRKLRDLREGEEYETSVHNTSQKIKNKNVIQSIQYDVPNEHFGDWWADNQKQWWIDSITSIFDYFRNKGKLFIYRQGVHGLDTQTICQLFRDGITNCLFLPIGNWAQEKMDEAKSQSTKSRYNVIIKKINIFEEKYKAGVPEDALFNICNELQIDITVELPFGETPLIEAQSIKKRLRLFRLINTRLDHVELNEISTLDKPIEVTLTKLLEIKDELDEQTPRVFCMFQRNLKNVVSLSTASKSYKVINEYSKIANDFEIETGLKFCKIDDVNDADLSKFVRNGTHYNGTRDFQNICVDPDSIIMGLDDKGEEEMKHCTIGGKSVHHMDMYRAYTQFRKCWLYEGFLGKITDFRQTDRIMGVGIYKITNLDFSNCLLKFKQIHDVMKIYQNFNNYTSADLKMLDAYKVKYTILGGCWGVKTFEFDFNEDMMEKKDNGVRYYAKWTGAVDSHKMSNQFWMTGDDNYFKLIKKHCRGGKVMWYDNGEGKIEYPKSHNFHLGHITAFITAYQRISCIEQLLEFDYSQLVRVCVDGIYYTGEDVPLKNVFRPKEGLNFNNDQCERYCDKIYDDFWTVHGNDIIETKDVPYGAPYREHFQKELHLGEGGSGKTHYNCIDKGLIKTMFLSPSWKLARAKKNELGINCSVWARAICEDPEKINFIRERANVLIIDEVSMLNEDQKMQLFETYSDMKIIMCGDLGFQLPPIYGIPMQNQGFDNVVRHDQDYRCNDPLLKEIKKSLRAMIASKIEKEEINKWVVEKFKKIGRFITADQLQEKYAIQDMILTGTNETKDFYTGLFKGKFTEEKYFVKENTRLYCNGDIVISAEKPIGEAEIQHAFTTHSIQGETAHHMLFIDSSRMFDSRMFYTAISRAKSLEQIFIVDNVLPKFKYEFGKIYKITGNGKTYIGSTIVPLDKRFAGHKNAFKNYNDSKKFITSFELLSDPKASIEIIEKFKCNDLKELWAREAEIIQQYGKKCVNKTFNELKEDLFARILK